MRNRSLIRQDKKLRTLLIERFEELGLSQKQVVEDAENHDQSIPSSNLNRYLKNNEAGEGRSSLTESQIIWLCQRYCINIEITISANAYNYNKAKKNLNGKESH
jgi:hypothetical protein